MPVALHGTMRGGVRVALSGGKMRCPRWHTRYKIALRTPRYGEYLRDAILSQARSADDRIVPEKIDERGR